MALKVISEAEEQGLNTTRKVPVVLVPPEIPRVLGAVSRTLDEDQIYMRDIF